MGSSAPAPQPFQPPNQAGVAASLNQNADYLSTLGKITTNAAIPGYQSIYDSAKNNPYYPGAQASANTTGAAGMAFGQGEVAAGTGLENLAGSLGQYQTGIAQTAFDPQGRLYGQLQRQNLDQAGALAAQSGVLGSNYGTGLLMDANRNFNMDWANNKQQREIAGVGAIGQLDSVINALALGGGQLGTAGLNTMTEAGNLPSQTYNQQLQYQKNALDALVQGDVAAGEPFKASGGLDTSYLGIGQQASATAVQAYQAQQAADNSFWSGIGQLGGLAAGAFLV